MNTPQTERDSTKVNIPVDDNDVEGRRRYGRGEHGFEEVRRGILCVIDRFCRGLESPEALVPRQIETVKQVAVVCYKSLA